MAILAQAMRIIPNKLGAAPAALAAAALLTLPACAGATAGGSGRVEVVAAEDMWGSIAAQLGGSHAEVVSIVANPDTDPHAYEPTAQDGRSIAQARYVIVNGAGYDPWATRIVDAEPGDDRLVLTVADLAGRRDGDNPHMWYSPTIVGRVVDRIAADLGRIDPADAAYFRSRAAWFRGTALQRYDTLRGAIARADGGVPVGATESLVVDLAADLGLHLITPPDYMRAVAEGSDPTAEDKATVDAQVAGRQIRALVFNRQNATPDVRVLVERAAAAGIPVVAVTETLDPATATFQDWQADQLAALQRALTPVAGG